MFGVSDYIFMRGSDWALIYIYRPVQLFRYGMGDCVKLLRPVISVVKTVNKPGCLRIRPEIDIFKKWPPNSVKIRPQNNHPIDLFMWGVIFHVIWVAELQNYFCPTIFKWRPKYDVQNWGSIIQKRWSLQTESCCSGQIYMTTTLYQFPDQITRYEDCIKAPDQNKKCLWKLIETWALTIDIDRSLSRS